MIQQKILDKHSDHFDNPDSDWFQYSEAEHVGASNLDCLECERRYNFPRGGSRLQFILCPECVKWIEFLEQVEQHD